MFKNIKTAEQLTAEKEAQLKTARITELKTLLSESDYKFNVDYDQKDTPEWLALQTSRQAWRDEIRTLEVTV